MNVADGPRPSVPNDPNAYCCKCSSVRTYVGSERRSYHQRIRVGHLHGCFFLGTHLELTEAYWKNTYDARFEYIYLGRSQKQSRGSVSPRAVKHFAATGEELPFIRNQYHGCGHCCCYGCCFCCCCSAAATAAAVLLLLLRANACCCCGSARKQQCGQQQHQ